MKKYIQPSMVIVKLQHQHVICTSMDEYGMNRSVQEETVDNAWTKESNSGVWDNEW